MNTEARDAVLAIPDMNTRIASAAPEQQWGAKDAQRAAVEIHHGSRKIVISAKQPVAGESPQRVAALRITVVHASQGQGCRQSP